MHVLGSWGGIDISKVAAAGGGATTSGGFCPGRTGTSNGDGMALDSIGKARLLG